MWRMEAKRRAERVCFLWQVFCVFRFKCVFGGISYLIEMCHTIPTKLFVSIFYPSETIDSYVDVFMVNYVLTYTLLHRSTYSDIGASSNFVRRKHKKLAKPVTKKSR